MFRRSRSRAPASTIKNRKRLKHQNKIKKFFSHILYELTYNMNLLGPKYSAVYFNPNGFNILEQYKNKNNIKFLEIGSFEGYSANYFISNFLRGYNSTITCVDPWIKYSESTISKFDHADHLMNENTYNIFMNNTRNNRNKIIIKRGLSKDILPTLHREYDFIYIDGDHSEEAVWVDAVLSFDILKINGIIIFDDYLWTCGDTITKRGIDKFIQEYSSKIKMLFINYKVAIQKISD
jgi:predicted O-methyltransferase YrrM